MEARTLDTLKLLDHVQFARANMVAAYLGGSAQNRKRELGYLKKKGLLFCPEQQKMTANYRYTPRVYAVAPAGKVMLKKYGITPTDKLDLKNFWHQLMISDVVISFAVACKQKHIPFKFQKDIIGNDALTFETHVTYDFPKYTKPCDRNCEPDYLFRIGHLNFLLEADRSTETIMPSSFENKSHLRSILQYRDLLKSKRYQPLLENIMVLNITTSDDHALNIVNMVLGELRLASSSMLFTAAEILGSYDTYPEPLTYLLDYPLVRAGYPDFIISKELENGHTSKTASTV